MYTPTDTDLKEIYDASHEAEFVRTDDAAKADAAGLRAVFAEAFECIKKKACRDEPAR